MSHTGDSDLTIGTRIEHFEIGNREKKSVQPEIQADSEKQSHPDFFRILEMSKSGKHKCTNFHQCLTLSLHFGFNQFLFLPDFMQSPALSLHLYYSVSPVRRLSIYLLAGCLFSLSCFITSSHRSSSFLYARDCRDWEERVHRYLTAPSTKPCTQLTSSRSLLGRRSMMNVTNRVTLPTATRFSYLSFSHP